MQPSTKNLPQTFHMSLVEPLIVLALSLLGIIMAVALSWTGGGDIIKMGILLLLSMYAAFSGLTMTRKLEIAGTKLIISHLVSKRVIARESIDAYFLDEQGINRRTRAFVTIHLVNGQRVRFKGIREGNDSLLRALEVFTGLKPAMDAPGN